MVIYDNLTYCWDPFVMHINIQSLSYTPEADMILYFNYRSTAGKQNKTKQRILDKNKAESKFKMESGRAIRV